MVAIPWQLIIMSPLGLTLTFLSTFMFMFLMLLLMRTPAMTFLLAGFGKRMILINPDEDRRIVFRIAKKDKDMAYVKKKGYYIIDPKHVHIEAKSRIPTAMIYGSFGESIDVKDGKVAEKLEKMGVRNYVELLDKITEKITAKEALKKKLITQEQYDQNKEMIYTIPKKNKDTIKIGGESVTFDNIVNYFSKNTRADLIESNIQHRISAIKMEKLGSKATELFKWAVIAVIVLVGGALAYNMVMMGRPDQAVQSASGIGGVVGGAVEGLTGGVVNGTGLV